MTDSGRERGKRGTDEVAANRDAHTGSITTFGGYAASPSLACPSVDNHDNNDTDMKHMGLYTDREVKRLRRSVHIRT